MSNHLLHLLKVWFEEKDSAEWVLGTVFQTEGPCYRKAGAMMLFSSNGHQLGMLSGGCLESDLQRHARKVMATGKRCELVYDAQDEDDLTFQLGIGCGGKVHILLQPLSSSNQYLALDNVFLHLSRNQSGHYYQSLTPTGQETAHFIPGSAPSLYLADTHTIGEKIDEGGAVWLKTYLQPPVHLLVCGGGFDARPVCDIAHRLGWRVTLWDPRPANARRDYFMNVDTILREPAGTLSNYCNTQNVNAAVVMTHSVSLDSAAIEAVNGTRIQYVALLGPVHRKFEVLEAVTLSEERLSYQLAGPAGLKLGAALPEGIALSILSECMAYLNESSAKSLSGIVKE